MLNSTIKSICFSHSFPFSVCTKVLCALASGKPIVLPAFWQCYSKMLAGSGDIALPAKFIPPADDEKLLGKENLCLPNLARKMLFKDKLFIFPTSQSFHDLQEVVTLAGMYAFILDDSCVK